ncbi:hypothetical protein MY11210_001205 [Beauveria gryllotalpidicola]
MEKYRRRKQNVGHCHRSIDGGGVEAASLRFTEYWQRASAAPLTTAEVAQQRDSAWNGLLALLILGMERGKKSDAAPAMAKKEWAEEGTTPIQDGT